jgi:hypothetical protein
MFYLGRRDTLGPKSGFHLYNPGPNSPPQALGDERMELLPQVIGPRVFPRVFPRLFPRALTKFRRKCH